MRMTHFTLSREEHVTEPFALPGGRRIVAELEMLPSVPVGSAPAEPDSLQLVVEGRAHPDDAFVELARTAVLIEPGTVSVVVPTPDEPTPFGERAPVARVRIVHTGRMQPRYAINLQGL